MIERISVNSVNNGKSPSKNQPQFKGLDVMGGVLGAVQLCEQIPMVNVAVLDLATAIIPRTVIESETNPYAGLEAFRRESSGLIVNCMIPSLIVLSIAQAIGSSVMGGKTGMADCWANADTINLVTKYWEEAKGATKEEKASNTARNLLNDITGIDGEEEKSFAGMDFEKSVEKLTKQAFAEKCSSKEADAAYKAIVEKTHIAENIKIKGYGPGYFSQDLKSVVKNMPKILKELINGTDSGIFANRAKKLINLKSFLGLGIIIPLAISMQPINRWITAKTSGKKGAPIYKDFAQTQSKELTHDEKTALFRQKLISVGAMIGVSLLSMMKKPNMEMFKFKGIFPTMDQARLISTATFASRMMASEDKNDLREATVRDIATFSAFYFLGDYVAKGLATAIQKTSKCKKEGIKLINVLEKAPGKDANIGKKFWHWAKHTALKSSDEVFGKTAEATKYAKKMRSVCQLGNITFSLIALGLLIPKINRKKTDKKREEELKKMGIDQKTIDKYYPHMMGSINFASNNNTYKEFFTSK